MLGSIVGDVVGSVFEWNNYKGVDFSLFSKGSFFTDDSVMTLAVADALLCMEDRDIGNDELVRKAVRESMIVYGRSFPDCGYGSRFREWLFSDDPKPYFSFGNGSAMRVASVAYFALDLRDALRLARLSAEVTHNHPEGIKGAQAVAGCVYLARSGESKVVIREFVEDGFYNLDFTLDEIRDDYSFDVSCQGSVPEAIVAFLESDSFESAIRLAVSIGGDSDTVGAIAGGIAGAFYGVPDFMRTEVVGRLDPWLLAVVEKFDGRFGKD